MASHGEIPTGIISQEQAKAQIDQEFRATETRLRNEIETAKKQAETKKAEITKTIERIKSDKRNAGSGSSSFDSKKRRADEKKKDVERKNEKAKQSLQDAQREVQRLSR